jgi:ankyrin repeat and BTB/POZ domain-containing protein 2
VYLAAGLENLLEEIMMQCMPPDQDTLLTASVLEHAIANNGDLWGLLQPYAHLNAGRTATGALALPRWPSQAGVENGLRGSISSNGEEHGRSAKTLEQSLLTTCVGSINELHELLQRVTQFHFRHSAPCPGATANSGKQPLTWASSALHALFYFMRCSQVSANYILWPTGLNTKSFSLDV